MANGDEIRDAQRTAWAALSAGWEKWDSIIMDQLGPVGTAMIGGPAKTISGVINGTGIRPK